MEKTGSQNQNDIYDEKEFSSLLSLIDHAQDEVEKTPEFKTCSDLRERALALIKKVGQSKNLKMIIQLEDLIINHDLAVYEQKDPSRIPSLKAAALDLKVIKEGLDFVEKHESYNDMARAYHPKKKGRGVPVDSTHDSMNSHITRLGNEIRASVSIPEKNSFRQRQKNMHLARELYNRLQQKALGIEPVQKSKGIER